jgi:hypothetical protein
MGWLGGRSILSKSSTRFQGSIRQLPEKILGGEIKIPGNMGGRLKKVFKTHELKNDVRPNRRQSKGA